MRNHSKKEHGNRVPDREVTFFTVAFGALLGLICMVGAMVVFIGLYELAVYIVENIP